MRRHQTQALVLHRELVLGWDPDREVASRLYKQQEFPSPASQDQPAASMALRVCQQWLRFMGRGYDVALTGGPHAEPPVAVAQALADIRISAALELTTAGGEGCVNDWSN